MQLSLILHSDIYRGWLQFRGPRSAVVKNYFDALPCFSNDIQAILSIKYHTSRFIVKSTSESNVHQFYAKHHYLLNFTAMFTTA